MVTFLNFNFLLFFILFFPNTHLFFSKYTFLFSFLFLFFFFTLCFSPPHTYTPFYLHSIFTATPTIATSENTVNKIPSKISSIAPKCPQIRKHKPTAHNRSKNTNTNPHRRWAWDSREKGVELWRTQRVVGVGLGLGQRQRTETKCEDWVERSNGQKWKRGEKKRKEKNIIKIFRFSVNAT